jgi:hypothetical protein
MLKRLNLKQIILFILAVLILIEIITILRSTSRLSTIFGTLVLGGFILYCTLRLFYITAEPDDSEIQLKPRARSALMKGFCPFCRTNPYGHEMLKVGYRKPHLSFAYKIFWIEWNKKFDELSIRLPICENCKKRFLALRKLKIFARVGLDRSYHVLPTKRGYFRGLLFSLESWNIKAKNHSHSSPED